VEREAVAYVLSLLDDYASTNMSVSAALVASGAHDPKLLAPVREDHNQTMTDLTKGGLSFERAAVIMLATNGLRLWEVLSLSPFNAEERHKIVQELLALAEENKRQRDELEKWRAYGLRTQTATNTAAPRAGRLGGPDGRRGG